MKGPATNWPVICRGRPRSCPDMLRASPPAEMPDPRLRKQHRNTQWVLYKSLRWWCRLTLIVIPMILNVSNLNLKLMFYFRHRSCFSLEVRKSLVTAIFQPGFVCGDLLYMNAPVQCLYMLEDLLQTWNHHSNSPLCSVLADWLSLSMHYSSHCYIFMLYVYNGMFLPQTLVKFCRQKLN